MARGLEGTDVHEIVEAVFVSPDAFGEAYSQTGAQGGAQA
jgi:hypothetical protein